MNTSRTAAAYTSTAVRMLLLMTLVLGIAYPAAMVGVGYLMPARAHGSIITVDGQPRGSKLIGQDFSADTRLFQSRPSQAGDNGYDPLSSGASNLGPTSEELAGQIHSRRQDIETQNPGVSAIPADALTASGSGLDPHISKEYAVLQIPRIAKETGLSVDQLNQLVTAHTDTPALGLIGQTRVNVLELNLDLLNTLNGKGK